jgi:hypothetical protein
MRITAMTSRGEEMKERNMGQEKANMWTGIPPI